MKTDYKIHSLIRHDDGRVSVTARIYEGDETTQLEPDSRGLSVPVARYRRSALLRQVTVTLPDLPRQATDAQIRRFLNDELKKDATRTPIAEQTD